jgi:signal transduction protein with GAF and PtsI domain
MGNVALAPRRIMVVGTGAAPALGSAVEVLRHLFESAACSISLVDDEGAELVFVAADGAGAAEIVGQAVPVGRGIAGWAAMSGQPIAVGDVQADPRFARDVAESTSYVPRAILAAPIMGADGDVLGVLSVLDPEVDETSDWVLRVLGTGASLVALLVEGSPSTRVADTGLEVLGREVLQVVEGWRSSTGGEGSRP